MKRKEIIVVPMHTQEQMPEIDPNQFKTEGKTIQQLFKDEETLRKQFEEWRDSIRDIKLRKKMKDEEKQRYEFAYSQMDLINELWSKTCESLGEKDPRSPEAQHIVEHITLLKIQARRDAYEIVKGIASAGPQVDQEESPKKGKNVKIKKDPNSQAELTQRKITDFF